MLTLIPSRLPACLPACLPARPPARPPACPPVCLTVCLTVCLYRPAEGRPVTSMELVVRAAKESSDDFYDMQFLEVALQGLGFRNLKP